MQPSLITQFDDKPNIVRLHDGTLMAFFFRSFEGADAETARYSGNKITARLSNDNGQTWGEDQLLLTLPTDQGGFFRQDGLEVLVDHEGEIHLFCLNDAKSGVVPTPEKFVAVPGEDQRPTTGSMTNARLDIWHTRSSHQRTRWPRPKPIWKGYSGSLNSVAQLHSGRIVLPFSYLTDRTWEKHRGNGFYDFTFAGQYDCTVIYSDDQGRKWHASPSALKVPVPDIVSAYGACEPVVIELRNGRVWMLIRTQNGRFYESFSKEGAIWSEPQPTNIFASDSPPALEKLSDGRVVMFWNNCLRFPYAYGGRHIMHAAISEDGARTWRGYREVARDPKINEPPPRLGDHGVGYPTDVTTRDDKLILSTGQGGSKHHCVVMDPAWLYQTQQKEHFSNGLSEWSIFGTRGVELKSHPGKKGARLLAIRKTDRDWPAAAVWNFPCILRGHLRLKVLLKPGFAGARIGLTDHFSAPFDAEDKFHNLFNLEIGPGGKIGVGSKLRTGVWHTLKLKWDCARLQCGVSLNGKRLLSLPQLRVSVGPSYLRLCSTAEQTDRAGFWIESVEVDA